ncbi:MAG: 6,7-dimethyl-8-ribityllumazine synthase [Chloroflexi bacterium]|nr:6,7-dimethyl-8-ribityllumazine synthase [Chloroflexota bacterium]
MAQTLEGDLDGHGLKIAVVVARFNSIVTNYLLAGAEEALRRHGVADNDIEIAHVPGSFEIPLVAKRLAQTGRYDAVICIGAVIRGETDHYDHVAGSVTSGVARVGLDTGVPTIFGVLTTDTVEQALNRSGLKAGNNGYEAAVAAIEMASLLKKIPE